MFAIVSHFLLALTNTLAFYVTEIITATISFMIQAPGDLFRDSHYATLANVLQTFRDEEKPFYDIDKF